MPIQQLYQLFKQCEGVSTDTRSIKPNELFVALKGENFNGNQYAQKAIEIGAKYAIIDEEAYLFDKGKCILVPDALKALQNLANFHRKQFDIPVFALTGSNGKTTTKEMLAAVLAQNYSVTATKGNLNNHIGVPLTLLNITSKTGVAIIEMGANHLGEIMELCEIADPDYGLITTIGKAHLEGFGSLEGIRKTKLELFDYLKANNGFAFINADQQEILDAAQHFDFDKKATYGQSPFADFIGIPMSAQPMASLSFEQTEIRSKLFGNYNFINILAAIAVGKHFKISNEKIKSAIENYEPQNKRSQIIQTKNNTLILDAYNANPGSMEVAIREFGNYNHHSKKMMILGDMFELGDFEQAEHLAVIRQINDSKIDEVYLCGTAFYALKNENNKLRFFETNQDLQKHFQAITTTDYDILIKGSRGMKLEQLVEYF